MALWKIGPDWGTVCRRHGTILGDMMTKKIKDEFHKEMLNVYQSVVSESAYPPRHFRRRVESLGGLAAAKQLLHSPDIPYGLMELKNRNCLHLSMEVLVLKERWKQLFSEEELRIASKRLKDLGYDPLS